MISRKDALTLASRTLATLLIVWALTDVSYLPERLHSYLHYLNHEPATSGIDYMRHYHLIELGFLVARVVGYLLMARWLFQGGSEIEELLLPHEPYEGPSSN